MRAYLVLAVCVIGLTACSGTPTPAAGGTSAGAPVLYEGARLIGGDGSAPIENAAFVVQNGKFVRIGRTGEMDVPDGGTRVNLAGKTVMPALVSTHVHIGLLDGLDFGPQVYTHDHIVEDLQRYAYYGLAAVLSPGTDVGSLAFQVRAERPARAARLLTAGRGMAAPDGGPGIPSIANVSFPITNAGEGRQRVRELAAEHADAVKIWVDDRLGRVKKLTPDIYGPIIDEAHKHKMMALAHVYYLTDAHGLVDAGIDGFMHLVRDEIMDDDLIAKMKSRHVFTAANLGGTRRGAVDELPPGLLELLAESEPPSIVQQYGDSFAKRDPKTVASTRTTYDKMKQSLANLNAAGVTITLGGDTGIPGAWHGWAEQYQLESMVDAGMTPAQVIVAATSAAARVLKRDDLGSVAAGKTADFLVLDANPLDDITNTRRISAVYLDGRPLDRVALRARWTAEKPQTAAVPRFKVDPDWPKPFPAFKDKDGHLHRWATGEVGGTCVDSHDHIFTLNRGWQQSSLGKLQQFEAMSSIPAPPVVVYDPQGVVVASWGDASLLAADGGTKVMPESLHGCFADYQDNIWIGGNADGVVQKVLARRQAGGPDRHQGRLRRQGAGSGAGDPRIFPDVREPGPEQQPYAAQRSGRYRRRPEPRSGHARTRERLHRRRLRQSSSRCLRRERQVFTPVGGGRQRPRSVRRTRRRAPALRHPRQGQPGVHMRSRQRAGRGIRSDRQVPARHSDQP